MAASKITFHQRLDENYMLTVFDPIGKIIEIPLGTDRKIAWNTAERMWSAFQSVSTITDATKG